MLLCLTSSVVTSLFFFHSVAYGSQRGQLDAAVNNDWTVMTVVLCMSRKKKHMMSLDGSSDWESRIRTLTMPVEEDEAAGSCWEGWRPARLNVKIYMFVRMNWLPAVAQIDWWCALCRCTMFTSSLCTKCRHDKFSRVSLSCSARFLPCCHAWQRRRGNVSTGEFWSRYLQWQP